MGEDRDRRQGRPLIGVGALIFSRALDAVLLVKRGAPPAEGKWSLPGGLVERGESLRAACARELLEETGVTAAIEGEVKVLERIIDEGGEVAYHFLIVDFWGYPTGGEPRPGSDVAEARFFPLQAVARLDATYGLADVVQRGLDLAAGRAPTSPLFAFAPPV